MLEGKINSLQVEKGFGFIKPNSPGPDVFFHYKTLQRTKLESLEEHQPVWYELDPDSERPRARLVSTTSRVRRGSASLGERRNTEPTHKGHVTNLKRRTREGFISPTQGGKEVVFSADAVWDRAYNGLETGQYVEYEFSKEIDDQGRAIAKRVKPTERHVTSSVPKLGRHPKARKKKPTWRG